MVLGGVPPVQFLATARAAMYARVKASRLRGNVIPPRTMALWRERARRRAIEVWARPPHRKPTDSGHPVLEAVLSYLEERLDRPWGGLSYRMTQVLIGDGCFGEYLCQIGKEPTTHCHHCDAERDCAAHAGALLSVGRDAQSPEE
ncbi:uncharacterized protein LOC120360010 [Solenopsis invicta]|uniref:uncharacterized protein LOC105198039 n=1 Tax=Solenopsis invicta TaxID=13686 RepID=UPI000595E243|nr:uncharacterized protein LOC105198039 [Solenopsis invicta]XP_039315449.1 uncharacterized protein LOC120360010 [Solenopsis invicta]